MSSPLMLLRPLRYDRVREVLIIQTETGAQLGEIVARVRAIFPACRVHLLVREAESGLAGSIEVEQFEVARWEERFDLLSRLRRRRYDVTVLQLGTGGPSELRLLPFLMRTKSLVAFNASLDYFPLNVFRLTTLAHHFALVQGEMADEAGEINRGLSPLCNIIRTARRNGAGASVRMAPAASFCRANSKTWRATRVFPGLR